MLQRHQEGIEGLEEDYEYILDDQQDNPPEVKVNSFDNMCILSGESKPTTTES